MDLIALEQVTPHVPGEDFEGRVGGAAVGPAQISQVEWCAIVQALCFEDKQWFNRCATCAADDCDESPTRARVWLAAVALSRYLTRPRCRGKLEKIEAVCFCPIGCLANVQTD